MGKSIDSAWVAPSGTTRARRGTLSAVQLNFWTAFSSLNPPLLHYSKNRWENKFLGLGDGRFNENINVERKYVIHHTKVPSFETFQKNKKKQKENAHIWKLNIFFLFLSIERMLFYYLRRPFMGFVFVSNTGRAGFAGRAAFHLEPGCLIQKCPEECLEKLIFSLPIHVHNNINNNNNKNNESKTRNDRHGFGRLGGRWPRQAWRGGRKSREDGPES